MANSELTRHNLIETFLLTFPEFQDDFDKDSWGFTSPEIGVSQYYVFEVYLARGVIVPGLLGEPEPIFFRGLRFFELMVDASDPYVRDVASQSVGSVLEFTEPEIRDAVHSSPHFSDELKSFIRNSY